MKKAFFQRILVVFFLLFFLPLLTAPANFLKVTLESGEEVFRKTLPSGLPFVLRFIHSVELTPVEGEYRVVGGLIRQWEERIRSHNAGLPAEAPGNGRFLQGKDWMTVQGGRAVFSSIRYRVGNCLLGRNSLFLGGEEIKLYRLYPDSVLLFRAETASFAMRFLSGLF